YLEKSAEHERFIDIRFSYTGPASEKTSWVSLSGEPIFEHGAFRGYRGIGRDVTAEMESAQQLLELAAENAALIEKSLDMLVVFDQDGRIVRINSAVTETLGYLPEDVIGRPYPELIFPAARESAQAVETELRKGDSAVHD